MVRTVGTSTSGRYQLSADSRGHTWKVSPNSIGPTTARGSYTTHPGPEIRCTCQPAAYYRIALPSSPRLQASTLTFSCGPDSKFIYFVQGSLPDKLDVWRITPAGGSPQRITSH